MSQAAPQDPPKQISARTEIIKWLEAQIEAEPELDEGQLAEKAQRSFSAQFFERLGRQTAKAMIYEVFQDELKVAVAASRLKSLIRRGGLKGNGKFEVKFKSIFDRWYEEVGPGRKVLLPTMTSKDVEAAVNIRRERSEREGRHADWLSTLRTRLKGGATIGDRWTSKEVAEKFNEIVGA